MVVSKAEEREGLKAKAKERILKLSRWGKKGKTV